MTTENSILDSDIFPLDILLFSAGGFFFGVYASQVKRVNSSIYQEPYFSTKSQKIKTELIIVPGDGYQYRLGINDIEDLVVAEKDHLITFPPAIAHWAKERGMWSIILRNKRIYTLLDFKEFVTSLPDKYISNRDIIDRDLKDSYLSDKQTSTSNNNLQYTLFNGNFIIIRSGIN